MKTCLILHKYGVPLDDPCCYPLGFMYVAAAVKARGHDVKVLNYNLWDYDLEGELKGQDVAMFTGFEEFKPLIMRDSEICAGLGIRAIVGGALATFGGLPDFKGDVMPGEIEGSCDIDRISPPDYEAFGIREYHKRHDVKYMGVLTSRGCPWSCTFCAQTCAFRMRDLAGVFLELDTYRTQYGIEMVVFNDNTLNINKPRFMKICAGMKKRGTWAAAIRCQPFDEDMARAARDSGCQYLVVGVESFDQAKLDRMNKKIKVRSIVRTLDLLHKYKIDYHGNLLFGFDGETAEDINRELQTTPDGYNLFPAMVQPFIGTRNGRIRSLPPDVYGRLDFNFRSHVKAQGKHCYPALGEM